MAKNLPAFCNTYLPELSQYIGEVGKREEFFVKLVDSRYIHRLDTNVFNVVDRNGNYGVFFSNESLSNMTVGDNRSEVSIGDCLLIKMTPKKQEVSTYHGAKETTFNRLRIIQNVGSVGTAKS